MPLRAQKIAQLSVTLRSLAECGLLCNTGLTETEGGGSESEQVSGAAGRKMAHHREQ